MDLNALIEAVEAGHFLQCADPWEHEVVAYRAFSGSLDAALALKEALLGPDMWFCISGPHGENGGRYKGGQSGKIFDAATLHDEGAIGPTPARALLLAVLRAYRHDQQRKEGIDRGTS